MLKRKVGIINRGASFGGGGHPSRSIAIRVLAPFLYLSEKKGWDVMVFDEDVALGDLMQCDVIFFCRHSTERSLLLHSFVKSRGIPSVYDVDDLMTSYPSYFDLGFERDSIVETVSTHLAMCDIVTVENVNIAASLPFDTQIKTHIIPNSFDFHRFPIRKDLSKKSKKLLLTNAAGLKFDRFKADFFECINSFCERYEYIVHVFSDLPSNDFPLTRMEFRGATTWEDHKDILSTESFEFAIVPLGGEEDLELVKFNSCKSLIKYIEYSATGIPAIFSNVEPYSNYLSDGVTAIMAMNDKESWLKAMNRMHGDSILRSRIREAAFNDVLNNFNIKDVSLKIDTLIRNLV